jgi:hypothetical protein
MRIIVVRPAQSDRVLRLTHSPNKQPHGGVEHGDINALDIHICEPGRHIAHPALAKRAAKVPVPVLLGIEGQELALKPFGEVFAMTSSKSMR